MTWDNLKSQSWNQTSLVRSGHSYEGWFNEGVWKGGNRGEQLELNRFKVQSILGTPRKDNWMLDIMCPWVWGTGESRFKQLKNRCKGFKVGSDSLKGVSLIDFLKSNRAREYFKKEAWSWMGHGWEYLALLTLLNLWTDALRDIEFSRAVGLFDKEVDKLKISSLMNSNGRALYLTSKTQPEEINSITYHSGGMWTVQLCPNNKGCSSDEGLSLTMGNGKFCIPKLICLPSSLGGSTFDYLKQKMEWISPRSSGTWTMVFGKRADERHLKRLLVALVVACFSDVKNVSLSVQEPSERGEMIFKLLEEKK